VGFSSEEIEIFKSNGIIWFNYITY
jgi:hypothetical protein